jgi:hypothetical protein
MHKLTVLLFLSLSVPAFAQSVLTINTQRCLWRAGDDPAWAAPTLDESAWHPYSEWNSRTAEGTYWVRCRIDASPLAALSHPAIQVRLSSAYELYINGIRVGSTGNLNNGDFNNNAISSFPISSEFAAGSTATISLRLTRHIPVFGPNQLLDSLQSDLQLSIGDKPLLDAMRAQIVVERSAGRIGIAVCYGIIGVIAVMLLGLFLYDRSRYDLLLLSIDCLCLTTARLNEFGAASMLNYSFALCQMIQMLCTIGFTATQLLFVFALARRRVPILFWVLMTATILITGSFALNVLMGIQQPNWAGSINYKLLRTLMLMGEMAVTTGPFFAFWPYAQIARRMRALAGLCMFLGIANLAYYGSLLPFSGLAHWVSAVLEFRAFTVAAVLTAILALLFRDQRQVTEERALLAGELHAASEIQRMLAPAAIDCAPGLQIKVAFHPMREVGGDFYLYRVLSDGRQRILLGDVSGKGSAAAMTAALILGGADDHDVESPAELLAHLNRILINSRVSGFATCLCADFSADGQVTLANAGHLAPYLRGEELSIPSGLPLGLSPRSSEAFQQTTFELEPGNTLTLISDGVVEARGLGGELFGFDRTRAISKQSAHEIAKCALAFGQEDDITVLTLTFAPAEVAHA